MDWKTKLLIGSGIVALISILGLIVKFQHDIILKQKELETTILKKDIGNNITRSETDFVTKKDFEDFNKSLDLKLNPIKEDLEKLGAKVTGTNVITVNSTGGTKQDQNSTGTGNVNPEPPKDTPDPYGYLKKEQLYNLNENFSDGSKVPLGSVGFSAWKPTPWKEVLVPRTYEAVNVLGVDEDGRNYNYSRFSIIVDGKRYPVKINDAKFVQETPGGEFRWNLRFYAGIDAGGYLKGSQTALMPNLELSLLSYGNTKADSDWMFLGFGLGYEAFEKRFGFIFSPVNYNIAHHIPMVDNIFIGPSIFVDSHADFGILFGVKFGL
jgi:hypothetical protein